MVKRLSNTDQNNSILTGLRGPVDPLDAVTKKYVDDNLAGKANTSHTHTIGQITGLQTALDGKQASGDYATVTELNSGLSSKANVSHTHAAADVTSGVFNVARIPDLAISKITNLQTTLNGKANSSHTHTIAQVTGLQTALDGKQAAGSYATTAQLNNHINDDDNPHEVTASQVGLGNVNNTSDANKPISTATQTALNGKANTSHTHSAGDVTSGTFTEARIPNLAQSKITGLTNALNLKANTSSLAAVATSGSYLDLSNRPTIANYTFSDGLTNTSGTVKLGGSFNDDIKIERTGIGGSAPFDYGRTQELEFGTSVRLAETRRDVDTDAFVSSSSMSTGGNSNTMFVTDDSWQGRIQHNTSSTSIDYTQQGVPPFQAASTSLTVRPTGVQIDATNSSDRQLNMTNGKIINVLDPTDPQDVATKAYVDASGGGSDPDDSGYTEISEAEITAGTASTARAISGRRAQSIVNKAISTATVTHDTINEKTSGAGVTIDGVTVKDGLVDGKNIAAMPNITASPISPWNPSIGDIWIDLS